MVFSSCKEKTPIFVYEPEEPIDETDCEFAGVNTENVLLRQVLHGYQCEAVYEDSVKYLLRNDDILALGDVLAEELAKMGLELNPDLFQERVKQTHDVDVTRLCHYSLTEKRMQLYMVPELYRPEPEYDFHIDLAKDRYNHIETVVFDPRVGLMYPALFLPEIINYSKRYPEIKKAESLAVMPRVNGEKIKKWSQESAIVVPGHEEILKVIFHINNYVLYENRESLNWLVKHSVTVLQSMFVDFHMEHDPIVDSLVLVRTRSGEARLEALFAEKNPDGSIYIREGLLDYISQNERLKAPRFQSTIRQYVAGCLGHDIYYDRMERFPQVLIDNFSLKERRFIVANIMNTVFSLYSGAELNKLIKVIMDSDPDFIEDTVKQDYYGFENLRSGLSVYRMRFRAERWKTITPTGKD